MSKQDPYKKDYTLRHDAIMHPLEWMGTKPEEVIIEDAPDESPLKHKITLKMKKRAVSHIGYAGFGKTTSYKLNLDGEIEKEIASVDGMAMSLYFFEVLNNVRYAKEQQKEKAA